MNLAWASAASAILVASTTFAARTQPLCLPEDLALSTCMADPNGCGMLSLINAGGPLGTDGLQSPATLSHRVFFIFDQSPGMAGFVREPRGSIAPDDGRSGGPGVRIFPKVVESAEAALTLLAGRLPQAKTKYWVLGKQLAELSDPAKMTAPCTAKCASYAQGGDVLHFIDRLWSNADELRLSQGDLIILITDLQDEVRGEGAGPLAESLKRHVEERSVLIAPFRSRFLGAVYDLPGYQDRAPPKGSEFDGEQPFYLVAIGDPEALRIFHDDLRDELAKRLKYLSVDVRSRKAQQPLLFTVHPAKPTPPQPLPVTWKTWERQEEGDDVRLREPQPVWHQQFGVGMDLPRYLVHLRPSDVPDGEVGTQQPRRLLKSALGSLPADTPDASQEICWSFGSISQALCPSGGAKTTQDQKLDITLWTGVSTIPGPWEYFRSLVVGDTEKCKPTPWKPYPGLRLVASVSMEVFGGPQSIPAIRLVLEISANPLASNSIPPRGTPILASLSVPLQAYVRSKLPTWLDDEKEPWDLPRTAVDKRIRAVNSKAIYAYGTGGLKELVLLLQEAAQPRAVQAGASGQSGAAALPVLLLFTID